MARPTDEQLAMLESRFGKIATIEFGGHTMVFQKPTYEHGLQFRRQRDAMDPARFDTLGLFTIVAFDDRVGAEPKDREPLRLSFKALLDEFPLLTDTETFQTPLAVLLGLAAEPTEGKGWRVSSSSLAT